MRDDLCITVPSFFRCPISLDVMRSPVSLSTGVSYDRESIQRWLDDGNDTCPATMQVLKTKDFVPNLTLQRLIQIWSDSVRHRRVDSPDDSPDSSVLTRDQVADLIQNSGSSESIDSLVIDSLSKIVCFARESGENRRFLAGEASGFVPMVAGILGGSNAEGSRAIDVLEMAVRALDMIRGEIVGDAKERLASSVVKSRDRRDGLRSLVVVLQKGSVEARIGSARVLEAIAVDDDEAKAAIAESDEPLSELLKLISPEKDAAVIEAGLGCLVAVAALRRAKARMVRLGAVGAAARCLSKGGLSAAAAEKALRLLEAAASVREGWREIGAGEAECVERVVERVLKVSRAATEHAVTVLWSVCCVHGCGGAAAAAARANGAAKMLLLMQTDCAPAVRQMAADLLKLLRLSSGAKNSAALVSCYDTNTTHIMPF